MTDKKKSFCTIILFLALALFILPINLMAYPKEIKKSTIQKNKNGEKTAAEVYKNIKVLKNIPASRLLPTMHFFEASLGMDCGSCHVRDKQKGWEFDKDKKPEKRKARKMIKMMDAINKNSFKGHQEVTCYTCHRGNPNPLKIPLVQTVASLKEKMEKEKLENETIRVPNRLNTAEEILNKYISASGGKTACEKINTLKLEGSMNFRGRNATITIYKKTPDLYYAKTKFGQGEMSGGFNGNMGWQSSFFGKRKLKGDNLEGIKLEAKFIRPIDLKKVYTNLKLNDISVINGDTVYVVFGKATQHRNVKLYFNTKTGMLIRQVILNKTPLGDLAEQTDYSDFREVNGVKLPFEINTSNYERVQDIKFNNITANAGVESDIFNMPSK